MLSADKIANPIPKLVYVKSGRYYFVPRIDVSVWPRHLD
jgi:hypothetical protein